MKVTGVVLVLLALAIGIVPQFTDCESHGNVITLANGKTIPMKCHWTARAEIAVALPLAGLGIALAVSRRRETHRALAVIGMLLGVSVILLPTYLIGTCGVESMVCNVIMKPALTFGGALTIAASIVALLMSRGGPAATGRSAEAE
jgi:hypothetical protein